MRIVVLADTHSPRRWKRCRRRFPHAALVVFGHSHIPWNEVEDGQRLFNPGSPTDRRRQAQGTLGELIVADGQVHSVRVVPVT